MKNIRGCKYNCEINSSIFCFVFVSFLARFAMQWISFCKAYTSIVSLSEYNLITFNSFISTPFHLITALICNKLHYNTIYIALYDNPLNYKTSLDFYTQKTTQLFTLALFLSHLILFSFLTAGNFCEIKSFKLNTRRKREKEMQTFWYAILCPHYKHFKTTIKLSSFTLFFATPFFFIRAFTRAKHSVTFYCTCFVFVMKSRVYKHNIFLHLGFKQNKYFFCVHKRTLTNMYCVARVKDEHRLV